MFFSRKNRFYTLTYTTNICVIKHMISRVGNFSGQNLMNPNLRNPTRRYTGLTYCVSQTLWAGIPEPTIFDTSVSLYRTILEKRIGKYSSISYVLWQVILVEGRNTLLYKLSYTLSYVRNDCLHAKFDSVAHLFHLTICRQESFAARKLVLKFSFNIDRKTAKFWPLHFDFFFSEICGYLDSFFVFMRCKDHNLINSTGKTRKIEKKILTFFSLYPCIPVSLYLSLGAEFQKSVRTIRFFGQDNPLCQISSF